MAAEERLITEIRKYVESEGGKVYKLHQDGYSTGGFPDLIVILPGCVAFVETKAPGERPTPVQIARMEEINDAGGFTFWTDSYENFLQQLC